MWSISHQPTAGIFCMTPILVAGLVESRDLLGHQGLPMLYLSVFYISAHLKSLVDEEKNWEELLRTEEDPAERARYNPNFFKRVFTKLRSESRLIEHRTSVKVNWSRKYNVLRLCRFAYRHLWKLRSNTASSLDIRTSVTLRPARVVHMLLQIFFCLKNLISHSLRLVHFLSRCLKYIFSSPWTL